MRHSLIRGLVAPFLPRPHIPEASQRACFAAAGVATASGKFGGQGNLLQAVLGLTTHKACPACGVDLCSCTGSIASALHTNSLHAAMVKAAAQLSKLGFLDRNLPFCAAALTFAACRLLVCCQQHATLAADWGCNTEITKACAVQEGRIAVYGDSNCLDSSHRRASCQGLLLKLIKWVAEVSAAALAPGCAHDALCI